VRNRARKKVWRVHAVLPNQIVREKSHAITAKRPSRIRASQRNSEKPNMITRLLTIHAKTRKIANIRSVYRIASWRRICSIFSTRIMSWYTVSAWRYCANFGSVDGSVFSTTGTWLSSSFLRISGGSEALIFSGIEIAIEVSVSAHCEGVSSECNSGRVASVPNKAVSGDDTGEDSSVCDGDNSGRVSVAEISSFQRIVSDLSGRGTRVSGVRLPGVVCCTSAKSGDCVGSHAITCFRIQNIYDRSVFFPV